MGVFWESDFIYDHMQDWYRFLNLKLLENPDRTDITAWKKRFFREFFGPAAVEMEAYDELIQKNTAAKQAKGWSFANGTYHHVDLDTMLQAQALFDRAAQKVQSSPIYAERLQRTRLPVDITAGFLLPRHYRMTWNREKRPDAYPFKNELIRQRAMKELEWLSQTVKLPLREVAPAFYEEYTRLPDFVPEPLPFVGREYLDFTPEHFAYGAPGMLVRDEDSPLKYAFKTIPNPGTASQFPMLFGLHNNRPQKVYAQRKIEQSELPKRPEYRYYKLFDVAAPMASTELLLQLGQQNPVFHPILSDLVHFAGHPPKPMEIWVSMKVVCSPENIITGIFFDRIVAVKK